MKSNGSSRWSLDLSFIRKGAASVKSPLDGANMDLRWSILSVPTGVLPISVVECSLSGLGRTVHGYGDSLFYRGSLTQAFAEAWERLCFEFYRDDPSTDPAAATSSNGFACGATARDAVEAARAELVERAVLLAAWHDRRGWTRDVPTGYLPRVLASLLESRGWGVSLFRIAEQRLGYVYCAFGMRPGGVLFDSCYQRPGMSPSGAQTKVLRSLLRSAVIQGKLPASPAPLPESGGPEAHRSFYADPAHAAAFEFLQGLEENAEPVELGGYGAVRTSVLEDVPRFPRVAVASNHRWPRLAWGRESIQEGGNEWPHPLA